MRPCQHYRGIRQRSSSQDWTGGRCLVVRAAGRVSSILSALNNFSFDAAICSGFAVCSSPCITWSANAWKSQSSKYTSPTPRDRNTCWEWKNETKVQCFLDVVGTHMFTLRVCLVIPREPSTSLQLSISGGMSLTSMSNPQTTQAFVATANASSAERTPSAKPRVMARMTWKQYEQNRLSLKISKEYWASAWK